MQIDNDMKLTLGAGHYKIAYLDWEKDIYTKFKFLLPV